MSDHVMMTCTYEIGDDLLKVIGEIVVAFGHLEHIVANTIKRTTKGMTLAEAEALTNGIVERSKQAQEAFQTWAMDQNLEGEFGKKIEAVQKLARLRNDVVHGFWGIGPKGDVQWRRKGQLTQIEIEKLKALRTQIQVLSAAITQATRPDLVKIELIQENS